MGRGSDAKATKGLTLAEIVAVSEHIAASDSKPYYPAQYGDAVCDTVEIQDLNPLSAHPAFRHHEGAVVIFADGHSKWYKQSYLISSAARHHWYSCNENHYPF
jgi:hypothetical protein